MIDRQSAAAREKRKFDAPCWSRERGDCVRLSGSGRRGASIQPGDHQNADSLHRHLAALLHPVIPHRRGRGTGGERKGTSRDGSPSRGLAGTPSPRTRDHLSAFSRPPRTFPAGSCHGGKGRGGASRRGLRRDPQSWRTRRCWNPEKRIRPYGLDSRRHGRTPGARRNRGGVRQSRRSRARRWIDRRGHARLWSRHPHHEPDRDRALFGGGPGLVVRKPRRDCAARRGARPRCPSDDRRRAVRQDPTPGLHGGASRRVVHGGR